MENLFAVHAFSQVLFSRVRREIRFMRSALVCLVLISYCGVSANARPVSDWASLTRTSTISPGSEVQAITTDNKHWRGMFHAADDDSLIFSISGKEQRLARATVSRILVRTPGRRLRHTLIGLGIGTAAGLTLGAVVDARCTGNCIEGGRHLGIEAGAGLGALIGVVIGAAVPAGGWREIYRAK
jgi:hypothetical protein